MMCLKLCCSQDEKSVVSWHLLWGTHCLPFLLQIEPPFASLLACFYRSLHRVARCLRAPAFPAQDRFLSQPLLRLIQRSPVIKRFGLSDTVGIQVWSSGPRTFLRRFSRKPIARWTANSLNWAGATKGSIVRIGSHFHWSPKPCSYRLPAFSMSRDSTVKSPKFSQAVIL